MSLPRLLIIRILMNLYVYWDVSIIRGLVNYRLPVAENSTLADFVMMSRKLIIKLTDTPL